MIFNYINHLLSYVGLDFITLCIVLTVCIVIHRLLSVKRYSPPLPPSPTFSLPVIGHLHLLDHDMRKVFRKYHKQVGDVYSLQLGERLGIVIAGYEPLKEAFLKQAGLFSGRPSMYMTDKVTRKSGVVLVEGPVWKEHRRFCLSTMKDFGMGKSLLETKVHEEVKTLLAELKEYSGKPLNPKTLISTHIVNIISSIVFGGQFNHDDERLLNMIAKIDENLRRNAGIMNFLPWLAKIPGDPLNVKKLLGNADYIFEYASEIIAEHEQKYDGNDIDDLTSAYIHEMKRLKDSGEPTSMSYEQLAAVICDLFIAGSHTTATAIRWAIPCLVTFPNIQEKLFNEIATVVGTERLPSVQDKTRLVYLEAFYLEVLRYCNLTIASGIHSTIRDVTFKGFTIPSDAIILPDLDSVFTDKKIWGDPEIFRPERFIDESGDLKKKEELIVFFLGKRSCMGESLARMELLIFLGALIQNFKFESCPGDFLTVDQVDGVFGFVHGPKDYEVVMTSR